MQRENTASKDSIKFPRMKFRETFLEMETSLPLLKIPLFTLQALIPLQKRLQICSF